MTPRQQQLLSFVEREIAASDVCPSFDQIRQHLGLASKGNVHRLMTALVEQGRLRRQPRRARAVEVVRGVDAVLTSEEVAWCHSNADRVRQLMQVAAGAGLP